MKIDLKGNWRHYQNPAACNNNWDMLGTVTRGIGDTGALAKGRCTGLYVQLNAGALRSLPQSQIHKLFTAATQKEKET